jgi:amino acid transporter
MNILAFFDHLLNFAAPAVFVGFFLATLAPWVLRKSPRRGTWMVRALSNTAFGLCALSFGLWFFGNDGKMASYLGLVLASAASQFCWMLAWRK